jgi:hypothetical protein
LSRLLLSFVKAGQNVTEDQLFWIAKIAEDFLTKTKAYAELLMALYDHPRATTITQAKVLKIPKTRFGMGALREEHLKVGKSDWLAWAAAVGARRETAVSRNHLLSYFTKASPMNRIVGECVNCLILTVTASTVEINPVYSSGLSCSPPLALSRQVLGLWSVAYV